MGAYAAVSDFGIKIIVLSVAIALLPQSPFLSYVNLLDNIPYLVYLNWFIPITDFIAVTQAWLLVVSVYYSILFATRFTGIVKG